MRQVSALRILLLFAPLETSILSAQTTGQGSGDSKSDSSNQRTTILTGLMYLWGVGDKSYITSAYVDGLGVVRTRGSLKRISRVFTAFTLAVPFNCETEAWKHFYLGPTLGFADGKTNEGAGFAMALGITAGWKVGDSAHFGLFFGMIHDPTIQTLPAGTRDGWYFPSVELQNALRQNPSVGQALSLTDGLALPTQSIAGIYNAMGAVLTINVDLGSQ